MTPAELLEAYLSSDEKHAPMLLEQLVRDVMVPVVTRIVRAKLPAHADDHEDIIQRTVARLVVKLCQVRENGGPPITDVVAWTMGAAANGCREFLRNEHPRRTQLGNAIRYRVSHSVVFRIWETHDGVRLCGWRRCESAPVVPKAALVQLLARDDVQERLQRLDPGESATVWRVLAAVCAVAYGRLNVSDLKSALAARIKEREQVDIVDLASPSSDQATIRTPSPIAIVATTGSDDMVIQKQMLGVIWNCIRGLKREERLSLLLQLKGPEGLSVFWQRLDGLSEQQVAVEVELAVEQLKELPLTALQVWDHVAGGPLSTASPCAEVPALVQEAAKKRQTAVGNWLRDAKAKLNRCLGSQYGSGWKI
jgi:hypothetical protein